MKTLEDMKAEDMVGIAVSTHEPPDDTELGLVVSAERCQDTTNRVFTDGILLTIKWLSGRYVGQPYVGLITPDDRKYWYIHTTPGAK